MIPLDDQECDVVVLFGSGNMAVYLFLHPLYKLLRRFAAMLACQLQHMTTSQLFARLVLRFAEAVGIEEQRVASL